MGVLEHSLGFEEKFPRSGDAIRFDKKVLVEELTSLGDVRITRQIARLVASEIDREIDRRKIIFLTSQHISEMVTARLEDLGLLKKSKEEVKKVQSVGELTSEVLEVLAKTPTPPKIVLEIAKPLQLPFYFSDKAAELFSSLGLKDQTLKDFLKRISVSMAQVDHQYNPMVDIPETEIGYYNLTASKEFFPCMPHVSPRVVLEIESNLESIFETLKRAAVLYSMGTTASFYFSKNWTAETQSVWSVMKMFDRSLKTLYPHGVWPFTLSIDHPEIQAIQKVEHPLFLSMTPHFLEAVDQNSDFYLQNGSSYRARSLFKEILETLATAPGGGFHFSPQDVAPYERTPSGAINLATLVDGKIQWEKLARIVDQAVRFLENSFTMDPFPFPEIEVATLKRRKISLGVMGWAECLEALGIAYNSEDALNVVEKMMGFIQEHAQKTSQALANERGQGSSQTQRRHATLLGIGDTEIAARLSDVTPGIFPKQGDNLEWQLRHQAVFEKYCDCAVYQPLPKGDIKELAWSFLRARQLGLKTLTYQGLPK